ncbi:hypothetical protein IR083_07275 [Dysgonomonas sp. GY75]|uniref:hypothetical protein n=1 Tax=Dysgonomonas sp. GY75 TaxID=2780419 RepID=UPI001883A6E0|nr:hypothetical protein [Dysgonomonas sp. GY75]MBF0648616.1 hypothetical protein [Dysgonomonas sp. GY75]
MGKYIVTTGQNLFDVALHIYGSIEGIIDLMMNNPDLSLAGTLKAGDELSYSDGYVIDAGVVAYYKANHIIPANGERRVYYKTSSYPLLVEVLIENTETNVSFRISGNGNMEIDWGDNSGMEPVSLEYKSRDIYHAFDNTIPDKRKIRLYGDFSIYEINLSSLNARDIHVFRPVYCEKLVLNSLSIDILFIALFPDLLKLDLQGIRTETLLPLIECRNLMEINLSGAKLKTEQVDEYLFTLVQKHYGRRSCRVTLTSEPSGEYREPGRDENSKYVITSGMEAVWLLCNEPSWNEGGSWNFNINGKTYTAEHGQDN